MSIQLSMVMRKGDWIKLFIIVAVGYIAITKLYVDYQTTIKEYEKIQQVANKI